MIAPLDPQNQEAVAARADVTVLVVDAEEFWRRMLSTVLKGSGFTQLALASTLEEALGILKAEDVHLCLVASQVRDADGMELIEKARPLRPDCVFLLTGESLGMDTALRAMDVGLAGFIGKPLPPIPELCAKLDRALRPVVALHQAARLQRLLDAQPAAVPERASTLGRATAMGVQRVLTEAQRVLTPLVGHLEKAGLPAADINAARDALARLGNAAAALEKLLTKPS